MHRITIVQVCDATDAAHGDKADNKNILSIFYDRY